MKKRKLLRNSLAIALVGFGALSLSSCSLFNKKDKGGETITDDDLFFAFSVGLKSGANIIYTNSTNESIAVYDNGIDTADRTYTYKSTDDSIASIDANGKITPHKKGKVNFIVKEAKSNKQKALKRSITIEDPVEAFSGGQNYSGGTSESELNKRAEILGKLEKYVMDKHLTGITLFDNGGYVRYSDRVKLPVEEYIEGFGFGLISDGEITGSLPGDEGKVNPTYLHEAIAQDSLKINQYTATGSQVSDLASYITSTYWSTKLNVSDKTRYDWYPCLAADEVKVPTIEDDGEVSYASTFTPNKEPIPMEKKNATGLYKKWRIYLKTDGVKGANLKYRQYTFSGNDLKTRTYGVSGPYDNKPVTIDDYEFIYQLLLTGSNNIIRGTEMANDSSYGIKGAQRYFNETKYITDSTKIQEKWDEYVNNDKLGIHKGRDVVNGLDYLDIELINPIDSFTAMYTLSSNLVSPLPKGMFVGPNAIKSTMKDAIQTYGTFDDKKDDEILNYTVCVGPFILKQWVKNQRIAYARNDNWFECGDRYHIPGIDFRVIDTSTDTEKVWKQLEAGNLDSAGVPSKKTNEWKDRDEVKATKGDSTFKLNVNTCTQEEWNYLKSTNENWKDSVWDVKPWMSNADFLDGLFYSINRKQFAEKRGVTSSINYFSDSYQMRNAVSGMSYNSYQAHKDAVEGYSEFDGYNFDKAVDCFRIAVQQLSKAGKITLGPNKDHPTEIKIHIRWMYQTDIKEYGEDIASYFETAFNDPSVCGGKVKLKVVQEAVTNWEDVYNVWMMTGKFDLGFGAISGNTYNPLNFLEVLKSDNSSSFTLNWGPNTGKVDEKNPIIYDGKKWSFDALWEVADHGGIVKNGEKIKPVNSLTIHRATNLDGSKITEEGRPLYNGYKVILDADFAEFNEPGSTAVFDANRFDVYIPGGSNICIAEKGDGNLVYHKDTKKIEITCTYEKAQEINNAIKQANGYDVHPDYDKNPWHENPFREDKLGDQFMYEFYYEMSINDGSASVNYGEITNADE